MAERLPLPKASAASAAAATLDREEIYSDALALGRAAIFTEDPKGRARRGAAMAAD